jgi:hypothetical protein
MCRVFAVRLTVHSADKTDAPARDGADELLLLAAVAHRLARRRDTTGKRRIRHDPAAPHRGEEIVLADHGVAVLHQVGEQIEDLRLYGNRHAAATQLAKVGIKYMICK